MGYAGHALLRPALFFGSVVTRGQVVQESDEARWS
jgi:hypothetical protein